MWRRVSQTNQTSRREVSGNKRKCRPRRGRHRPPRTVVVQDESRSVDVVLRTELRPWNLVHSEDWRRLASATGEAPVFGHPCRTGLEHTDQPEAAMVRRGLLEAAPGQAVRSVHRPAVGNSPCATYPVLVASSPSLGETLCSVPTTV